MRLLELFSLYDFHDSYIENFFVDFNNRKMIICLNLGDWQEKSKCTIEFSDIAMFHIEADNVDFNGNELKDYTVFSKDDGTEQFRGYFMDGIGTPGKVIELLSREIKILLE